MALKQQKDIRFNDSQITDLEAFINNSMNDVLVIELNFNDRLKSVKELCDETKPEAFKIG